MKMNLSSLLAIALLFVVWGSLEAKADTNLNFYFAGLVGASSSEPAVAAPVQEEELEELTCPSPTPAVCPAVATFNYCEEPEVEDYFAMDTSVRPHQIKAEYFGIYRPEGDEAVKDSDGGHRKRGAIAGCQAPMTYLGGPIMDGSNEVYFIYYGAFSSFHPNGTNAATTKTKSLMTQFVSSLSNSAWFNITTEYFSRMPVIVSKTWVWQTKYVPSTLTFKGELSVNNPYKYAVWNATWNKWFISAGGVAQAIQDTVGGNSKISNNAMYFFIPSSDVYTEGSCGYGVPNFQGAYCAYHTFQVINSTNSFKYAFISNPANNTSDYCTKYCSHEAYFGLGSRTYPNERAGDSMVSLMAHELVEMLTDPVWAPAARSAWLDQVGCENADMCSWTYGPTTSAANGGKTNLSLGGKQWLMQQNWVLSKNDCGMSR